MSDVDFWAYAGRMEVLARSKGLTAFDPDARQWRFELPLAFWDAAKRLCEGEYGWQMPDAPPTGESWPYLVFGYPFVVDPNLPPDGLRLVTR
jgi:hypothetical protein